MGTISTALYSDDTACDVREQFTQNLARLRDSTKATASLLVSWIEQIADMDDGPVFWLALADTQWKFGCLSEEVKNRAIEVIDKGLDLHRWEGANLNRRRANLIALKSKLLSEQPKARIPKLRRSVEVPSIKVLSPDERALATAFPLAPSSHPNAPRMQVIVEMLSSGSRGGGGIFVATCEYTNVQLDWVDSDTLKITYPSRSVVISQSETTFYFGRTIQIVYQARDAKLN